MTVSLAEIEAKFDTNAEITPKSIVAMGILTVGKGKTPMVKIVGSEAISKKFTIKGATISAGAKAAVEKAGGTIA